MANKIQQPGVFSVGPFNIPAASAVTWDVEPTPHGELCNRCMRYIKTRTKGCLSCDLGMDDFDLFEMFRDLDLYKVGYLDHDTQKRRHAYLMDIGTDNHKYGLTTFTEFLDKADKK